MSLNNDPRPKLGTPRRISPQNEYKIIPLNVDKIGNMQMTVEILLERKREKSVSCNKQREMDDFVVVASAWDVSVPAGRRPV